MSDLSNSYSSSLFLHVFINNSTNLIIFFIEKHVTNLMISTPTEITKNTIQYKCNWSPFEGKKLHTRIEKTFVNGELVFDNERIMGAANGMALRFDRNCISLD